jgi:hypothetical protein
MTKKLKALSSLLRLLHAASSMQQTRRGAKAQVIFW